jgi:hypothetical protein
MTEILLSITYRTVCRLHGRNINQPLGTTTVDYIIGSIWVARKEETISKEATNKENTHPPHRVSNVKARNQKSRVVSI